jgi:hypothetical protein
LPASSFHGDGRMKVTAVSHWSAVSAAFPALLTAAVLSYQDAGASVRPMFSVAGVTPRTKTIKSVSFSVFSSFVFRVKCGAPIVMLKPAATGA